VTFSPTWVGKWTAQLIMKNQSTAEVISYKINGIATEPRAIKHLKVSGKARSKISCTVEVANESDETRFYKVESDIPGIEGETSFSLKSGANKFYEFYLFSFVSGELTGSITFTDDTGK